jgi:aspergillopepsin I
MKGHTWVISYGDRSGAHGEVYVDRVTIENLTVAKQAVGVATSVSRTFVQDGEVDGLLGLGFTQLNSITPNPQKTWFDNIRANLSVPLFATALRRRRAGTYDFGFIDERKYVGNITWAPVDGEDGVWRLRFRDWERFREKNVCPRHR